MVGGAVGVDRAPSFSAIGYVYGHRLGYVLLALIDEIRRRGECDVVSLS